MTDETVPTRRPPQTEIRRTTIRYANPTVLGLRPTRVPVAVTIEIAMIASTHDAIRFRKLMVRPSETQNEYAGAEGRLKIQRVGQRQRSDRLQRLLDLPLPLLALLHVAERVFDQSPRHVGWLIAIGRGLGHMSSQGAERGVIRERSRMIDVARDEK